MRKLYLLLFLVIISQLYCSFENLSANPLELAGSGSLIVNNISFYAPVMDIRESFNASFNYLLPYEIREFQTSELILSYKFSPITLTGGVNFFGDQNYSETSLLFAPGYTLAKSKDFTVSASFMTNYNLLKTPEHNYSSLALSWAISIASEELKFKGNLLNFYSQKISRSELPLAISGDFAYSLFDSLSFLAGLEKTDKSDLYWRCGFKYLFQEKITLIISSRNPDFEFGSGFEYKISFFSLQVGVSWHKDLGLSYASGFAIEI